MISQVRSICSAAAAFQASFDVPCISRLPVSRVFLCICRVLLSYSSLRLYLSRCLSQSSPFITTCNSASSISISPGPPPSFNSLSVSSSDIYKGHNAGCRNEMWLFRFCMYHKTICSDHFPTSRLGVAVVGRLRVRFLYDARSCYFTAWCGHCAGFHKRSISTYY